MNRFSLLALVYLFVPFGVIAAEYTYLDADIADTVKRTRAVVYSIPKNGRPVVIFYSPSSKTEKWTGTSEFHLTSPFLEKGPNQLVWDKTAYKIATKNRFEIILSTREKSYRYVGLPNNLSKFINESTIVGSYFFGKDKIDLTGEGHIILNNKKIGEYQINLDPVAVSFGNLMVITFPYTFIHSPLTNTYNVRFKKTKDAYYFFKRNNETLSMFSAVKNINSETLSQGPKLMTLSHTLSPRN